MKPITTWILVADGARARVYQNRGPGSGLAETSFPEMVGSHEPARDINADRPGRMQGAPNRPGRAGTPGGGYRHQLDWSSDPHREQKRTFARDVAEFLKLQARRNAFDRLVIAAPAKTLGDLREALDPMVAGRITEEIPKDLTQFTVRELPQHLESAINL